jgi:alpha/beta hydrolase fold
MARSWLEGLLGELGAGWEFLSALASPSRDGLPPGDGSGVLLIPGLWGEDFSLFVLQRELRALGYDARAWGLGLNNRCGEETIAELLEVARRRRARHRKPLKVIGHSRGGFMARELARRAPELVDLVITLGTPIASTSLTDQNVALQAMIGLSRALFARQPGCMSEQCECAYIRGVGRPIDCKVTAYSLWSRDDAVVRPEHCVLPDEPNVEVAGSHIGMVANREVLRAIAQILAQHRASAAA